MKLQHIAIAVCLLLTSCFGEDRSDEQPFAPTVETVAANIDGPVANLEGIVTSSPNSTLTACGFHYGNDTLTLSAAADVQLHFFAATDTLLPGHYFAVAFAQNGIGTTSAADTIWFEIR